MNDEVANRLLKTLEEPAHFVHLILLTDALGQVLDTVISRCQLVRFDPLPAERIAAALEADGVAARARARLRAARARQRRARALARLRGGRGAARRRATRMWRARARARSRGRGSRWRAAARARRGARAAAAEEEAAAEREQRLEIEPKGRDRKALEREFEEAAKRDGRRARTEVLDLGARAGRARPSATSSASPRGRRRPCSAVDRAAELAGAARRATRAGCARRSSAARRPACRSS